MKIRYCPTDEMVAVVLTKSVARDKFTILARKLLGYDRHWSYECVMILSSGILIQNPEFSSNCYVLQSRHPPHLVEVGRDGSFLHVDSPVLIWPLREYWCRTNPTLFDKEGCVCGIFFDYETDPIAFGTRDMSTQVDLCMCFTSVRFSDMRYLWTLFIIMLPFNYESWEGSYCLLFYGSWLFTACLIARERCSEIWFWKFPALI